MIKINFDNRLSASLLFLRLVLAVYLLQWAWLHAIYASAAVDVYVRWYGVSPSAEAIRISGYVLALVGLMMALGICRRITYALAIVFFGGLLIGLIPHLIDPYGFHQTNRPNHAFIAQVPALTGYIALYALRELDSYSCDCLYLNKESEGEHPNEASLINNRVASTLLTIRIASAVFFFQWGVEKFVAADMSAGILERWYGIDNHGQLITMLLGGFEILLAIALLTGTLQRLTYAISALIKLKTCWAIAGLLLAPFATESGGRLSSVGASLPTLAVLCFLYAVRKYDRFSVDVKFRQKNQVDQLD